MTRPHHAADRLNPVTLIGLTADNPKGMIDVAAAGLVTIIRPAEKILVLSVSH